MGFIGRKTSKIKAYETSAIMIIFAKTPSKVSDALGRLLRVVLRFFALGLRRRLFEFFGLRHIDNHAIRIFQAEMSFHHCRLG